MSAESEKEAISQLNKNKNLLFGDKSVVESVVEDSQNIAENDITAIVDAVGVKVIQEEIINEKKKLKEHNSFLQKIGLGEDYLIGIWMLVSIVGFVFTLLSSVMMVKYGFSMDQFLFSATSGLVFVGAGLASFFESRKINKFYDIHARIAQLRYELVKKSLNAEIIETGRYEVGFSWDELLVSRGDSDEVVKCLIKLVEDKETGLETVKIKKIRE